MGFLRFEHLNTGSIGVGANATVTLSPERDVLVKRLYATERTAQALNSVFSTLTFEGAELAKPDIPLEVIGSDIQTAFVVDKVLHKGQSLIMKVTNNSAAAVNVDIVPEEWEA